MTRPASSSRFGLVALLSLLLSGGAPALAAAEPTEPRVIEVSVSQWGWNDDPELILTVEEGELVEFRFSYGDGDLADDNPHVMIIERTGLESGLLSRENPLVTLRFRPETVGTHTLQCIAPCHGHEQLKTGRVRVVPVGATLAGIEPVTTSIRLATVPPSHPGGEAEARAAITTEEGVPLEGVTVEFAVRTTFMMSGWLPLGRARTDASGEAVLRFAPNRGGDQTIRASYAGSTRYLGADRTLNLAVPDLELTYAGAREPLIPGLGFWLLGVIVAGIWLTYAFVVQQLGRLATDREGPTGTDRADEREGVL
jgi:hypothetical protein